MTNWFQSRKRAFSEVVVPAMGQRGEDISVPHLIMSCEDFIKILYVVPNVLFIPIHNRFKEDYESVLRIYVRHSDETAGRLTQVLDLDARETRCLHRSCEHATHKILLLANAFDFMHFIFNGLIENTQQDMSQLIFAAYRVTIGRCHNPMTATIFEAAIQACPTTQRFLDALRGADSLEALIRDARPYVDDMRRVRDALGRLVHARQIGLPESRPRR